MSAIEPFRVEPAAEGVATRITVAHAGQTRSYRVPPGQHQHYTIFFSELARDFGTRAPEVHKSPILSRPPKPTGDR
jgi:hypothetical protein